MLRRTISCLAVLIGFSPIFSQQDLSIIPVLEKVEPLIENLEDDFIVINRIEFDLIFEDATKYAPVKMYPGKTYQIIAYGEQDRISDLDIKLFQKIDDEWKVVKVGNSEGNVVVLEFTPDTFDFFEIQIKAPGWIPPYNAGRYCILVCY